MMQRNFGVIKTSMLENEFRVPIYPAHLELIPKNLRKHMIFEKGYGEEFGYEDTDLKQLGYILVPREEVIAESDILLFPKPKSGDLHKMKKGSVLWGWPHCVQQVDVAEESIQRELTLIAWESMHHWSKSNERLMHIFYKNNELAGYAGVLHALCLLGQDGYYGPRRKVCVLSYGSVSKGAIYALQGRGFNNIHVYTQRPSHLVCDQNPDVYYHQFKKNSDGELLVVSPGGQSKPLIEELGGADIIVNGILQDIDNPVMFVGSEQIEALKPRVLIVDISCDEGMGFAFAKPTSFEEPLIKFGNGANYYSVDHTPTYLWDAASREISKAVLPYLNVVLDGECAWDNVPTIKNAIEIKQGRIINNKIISFQKRALQYPHEILDS